MISAKDPFESDSVRNNLAQNGDFDALRETYNNDAYPELEDMSSARLWDELASCSEVPSFRIRRLQAVADRILPGSSVLDVGVGWGEIVPMILARDSCCYTGIDFSEQIVAQVSKRYPSCKFFSGDLGQIKGSFDAILALEVCEHILPSRIFGFFEQIGRLLAENGRLIITVPVYENLRAMTLRCPQCGHMHNRMGHVRAYTPELIMAELQLAGFEVSDFFFIYANFDNSLTGRIKRSIVDLGRYLLNLGKTTPLNVVMVVHKSLNNRCRHLDSRERALRAEPGSWKTKA
jgi:2-polyprenyl-3-methyl-5-hydroxy-6-metoxy-1,4-benzoquinol methylase